MNPAVKEPPPPDFEFSVRPYQPQDKDNIRSLCCETGFFGKPIDRIFLDRKWFADFNTNYYLKFEPNSCFVAESDGQLIGYVLGCKRPRQYGVLFYTTTAVPLFIKGLLKCLTGIYEKKSRLFILGLVFKASRERPKRKKNASHLHMNIKEGFRTQGVGRELGRAIVHHFEKNGVEWICGEAFHSDRMRDMSYYKPWGFQIYDKKESSLFSSKMGKIYMISVTINLKDPKIRKIWGL